MNKLVLVAVAGLAFAGVAGAQQPSMEDIVKKWDDRQASVKNVSVTLDVETTYPKLTGKSGVANGLLTSDSRKSFRAIVCVDFENERLRLESEAADFDPTTKSFLFKKTLDLFDGKEYRSAVLPDEGVKSNTQTGLGYYADAAVYKSGLDRAPSLNALLRPILLDCGRFSGSRTGAFYPATFSKSTLSSCADLIASCVSQPQRGAAILKFFPQKNDTVEATTELTVRNADRNQPLSQVISARGKVQSSLQLEYGKNGDLTGFVLSHHLPRSDSVFRTDRAKVTDYQLNRANLDRSLFQSALPTGLVVATIDPPPASQERVNAEPTIERFVVQPNGSWQPYRSETNGSTAVLRAVLACVAALASALILFGPRRIRLLSKRSNTPV